MHSLVHAFLTHPLYSQSSRPRVQDCDFSVFSPQKIIRGPSPHMGTALETPFSPLSFGKSFMKIRSAARERLSHIYALSLWQMTKKNKKTEKTSVKHIRIRAT